MDLQLQGKRALVTGSSSGIGEGIAKILAAEGALVVVHGRREKEAQAVAQHLTATGGRATLALGDLSSDEGADAVVKAATAAYGGIDILVNNAGAFPDEDQGWAESTPESWLGLYNSNVVSMIRLIKALTPAMRERRWGRVIQVASVRATLPERTQPDYAATKAAAVNLTVSLAKDMAGSGVTANTVSPGGTLTAGVERMFRRVAERQGWPTDDWDEIERRVVATYLPNPVGRLGRAEEVAALVAFVASPLGAYINGANLRIDGGYAPTVN